MYKRLPKIALFLIFSLSLASFQGKVEAKTTSADYSKTTLLSAYAVKSNSPQINKDYVKDGYVQVMYKNSSGKKMKISVKRDTNVYYYDFDGKGEYENYPLQMGSGKYDVTLLENLEGKKYVEVESWNIEAKITNPNAMYLISNKIVDFSKANTAVNKAAALTKDIVSNDKKVQVIYSYLINNVNYDYNKLKTVQTGYVPDIDAVVKSSKGICYDFSAVFAGMLRAVGVPTKVVMGYSDNVKGYHAWNEVYLDGKWIVVDTSVDSQVKGTSASIGMYKLSDSYQKEKEY
ncbi:transglutaminase-like domain-containing protein [Clostridium sp. CX1]|uniref:transglutaminase domain-containing protein n=1 Tax=Clostridium sp. CX1 TaxID=2978346 RepID=UPI0021C06479|nr:transglutaminase-like domain-containing protein [Clostridium sp. CX1]MCT8978550.1 transglutaminase-like domain-containing protein [Clostridium sp. CX1]